MPVTLNGTISTLCSQEMVELARERLKVLPYIKWWESHGNKVIIPYQKTKASAPSSKTEESFATPISVTNDLTIEGKGLDLSEHVIGCSSTDYFNTMSGVSIDSIKEQIEYSFYEKIDNELLDIICSEDTYTETVHASSELASFSDLDEVITNVARKGRENFIIYATQEQIEALEQEGSYLSKVLIEDGTYRQIPVVQLPSDSELPLVIVDLRTVLFTHIGRPSISDVPTMKAGTDLKGIWFYGMDYLEGYNNIAFVPKASIYSNPIIEGDWENFQATGALVDATGLTFKVDISGVTTDVTDDVVLSEPSTGRWSTTEGTQTAKWYYTQDDDDFAYFTKTASVEESLKNPVIEGDWTNIQKTGEDVDPTGLTFKATILGVVTDVTSSVVLTSPQSGKWADYDGTQTATWTYTTGGKTLTYNKNANVKDMTIRLGSLIKMEDFEQSTSYSVKFNPKVVVDDLIDDNLFIDHTVYTTASFDHWLGAVDNGEDKAVISYSSGSEILRVYPLLADEFDIDPNKYYVAVGAELEPSLADALPAEVIEYPSIEYTGRLWGSGETYEASDLIELASDYFVLPVTDDVED